MKNADVELIQRVLDGDDTAFSDLVKKYQKSVHALAWRKVQDFHIAEDITQETFLKAYKKLSTLKEPQSFASWLYVIAANHCHTWLSKKRLPTQSLESTSNTELEKATYSSYVSAENERASVEAQREVVKKLLAKLQESDRTVITLYYLGGMTYEEISKFLGVSVSSIKNRLYRARQHLKKEEPMIREALENYQITPHFTENVMQEVARLKPAAPFGSKPLVPWAIAASSAVLIVLMLGIGSQFLVRFQQPYSLDAQTEMAVELVDTPIVLNFEAEPDVQRQLGSANALGQNESDGKRPDEVLFAAAQSEGEDVSVPKPQWIQSEPIEGSKAYSMFPTPEGELYILGGRNPSIFKLSSDGKGWQHIFDIILLNTAWGGNSPIAKWKNTLYVIPSNELFASTDDGKSWNSVNSWPEYGYPIELVLTEQAFYIAFMNGISRSEDAGKTWEGINDGIMGNIRSIVMIQNTLFVGTSEGLFRLEDDKWQRVEFPVSVGQIRSVAVTDEKLYVAAELSGEVSDPRKVSRGLQHSWWIFRSIDLGNSWTDITPTNAWNVKGWPPFVKLIAVGETLLAMEKGMVRSTDSGNTWMPVQAPGTTPSMNADVDVAVVVNENDFYVGSSDDGLHHSTDKGKTWNKVNINRMSRVDNLILFKRNSREKIVPPILYARTDEKIRNTTNQGKSWNVAQLKIPMTALHKEEPPSITHILKYGGVIYAKGGDSLGRGKTRIYRISTIDGITLIPIQGMPIFDFLTSKDRLSQNPSIEQSQEGVFGATQFFKQLAQWNPQQYNALIQLGFRGGPFAISGDTFYLEYNYKLFRWKMGDTEWYDTEQEETVELTLDIARKDLKLAVSGDTVYVGKRDGRLVVSFDRGDNWIDLTPALPFSVRTFKEITVAGATVYVATDAGIITSDDGRNWQVVTDVEGTNLIMEHLAVDGATVYGVTKGTGIYRLKNGTWEQIVSDIPDGVTSLAVDENTLYVGTQSNGMLHYNLEK